MVNLGESLKFHTGTLSINELHTGETCEGCLQTFSKNSRYHPEQSEGSREHPRFMFPRSFLPSVVWMTIFLNPNSPSRNRKTPSRFFNFFCFFFKLFQRFFKLLDFLKKNLHVFFLEPNSKDRIGQFSHLSFRFDDFLFNQCVFQSANVRLTA